MKGESSSDLRFSEKAICHKLLVDIQNFPSQIYVTHWDNRILICVDLLTDRTASLVYCCGAAYDF